MRIVIETGSCRNQDLGDWFRGPDGTIHIRVAPGMPDISQIAVAVHELIEMLRCEKDHISDMAVTQFDAQFLAEQNAGQHSAFAEPGYDERAPYKQQHAMAESLERHFLVLMGVSWEDHEKACQKAQV